MWHVTGRPVFVEANSICSAAKTSHASAREPCCSQDRHAATRKYCHKSYRDNSGSSHFRVWHPKRYQFTILIPLKVRRASPALLEVISPPPGKNGFQSKRFAASSCSLTVYYMPSGLWEQFVCAPCLYVLSLARVLRVTASQFSLFC